MCIGAFRLAALGTAPSASAALGVTLTAKHDLGEIRRDGALHGSVREVPPLAKKVNLPYDSPQCPPA